jgi:hypothetical protein
MFAHERSVDLRRAERRVDYHALGTVVPENEIANSGPRPADYCLNMHG